MFVAHYSNTMANARPKFVQPEPVVVRTVEQMRQEARAARVEREAKRRAEIKAEWARRRAEMMAPVSRSPLTNSHQGFRRIVLRACKVFKLTQTELFANRRSHPLIHARHFIMYWTARTTRLSLPQIGRMMGGVDHTTVMNGMRRHPQRRAKMGRTLRPVR